MARCFIAIEHHQPVMAHADWIIDLNCGAGHDDGRIVFVSPPADLVAARSTLTGQRRHARVVRSRWTYSRPQRGWLPSFDPVHS